MTQPTENTTLKLNGKIFISGYIHVLTGLHIGGSKSDMDIGGVDLSVIKTPDRRRLPFIPGSSLKGKLRTMLAREKGSKDVRRDSQEIKDLFGHAADNSDSQTLPTRLIVRDAFLDKDDFDHKFDRENLDTRYTMVKWENTIDRKTGKALHPRQIERVPAGANFKFSIIYNLYSNGSESDGSEDMHMKTILKAMRLLEDDYLGGHGSRGYGQIQFRNVEFHIRKEADYKSGEGKKPYTDYSW
ncbi:MAG: type III-A CRISPR-associated RAMP protein Csm3 [Bacteroidia bacterium]|nr:type III-A CRISPR-associated RAMP protein Csm3 [Bacteroidia bacterium]